MRSIKIIMPLLAAAFALSACGGDGGGDGGGDSAGAGDGGNKDAGQEDTGAPAAEPKTEDLLKDVEVVECASGDGGGVSAILKVTNSLDEPMEYYGSINFLAANGEQLTDGLFNTGTLQPGESSTEDVPGANVYEVVRGATCEVVEVKLDEPA